MRPECCWGKGTISTLLSRANLTTTDFMLQCVMMLEDVTRMVSALDLFSRNESIEEVSTQSVKFFLLPFLLGNLNAKLSNDLEQVWSISTYQNIQTGPRFSLNKACQGWFFDGTDITWYPSVSHLLMDCLHLTTTRAPPPIDCLACHGSEFLPV